jgi:hypothetical protein
MSQDQEVSPLSKEQTAASLSSTTSNVNDDELTFSLTRDPSDPNHCFLPVFSDELPISGDVIGLSERTRQAKRWPKLNPRTAIPDGEDPVQVLKALSEAARKADTLIRDISLNSDEVATCCTKIAQEARTASLESLVHVLFPHKTRSTADVPLDTRVMWRKEALASLRLTLNMWENDHSGYVPFPETPTKVLKDVDSLMAGFSREFASDEEKLRLLAESDAFVKPTYSFVPRYENSDGTLPRFRWRPDLAIHLAKGLPGNRVDATDPRQTGAKGSGVSEAESIAETVPMDKSYDLISVTTDYSILQKQVIPVFEEYHRRIQELAGENRCADKVNEDETRFRDFELSCALVAAREQLETEIQRTLDLTGKAFNTLTEKFKRRALSDQKSLLQGMHHRVMYNERKSAAEAFALIEDMGNTAANLGWPKEETDLSALQQKRTDFEAEAREWQRDHEKWKAHYIREVPDNYTLGSLVKDVTKRRKKGSRADTEVGDEGSDQDRVTLPAVGQAARQSLRSTQAVIRFKDPELGTTNDVDFDSRLADKPIPTSSLTGKVSDETVIITQHTRTDGGLLADVERSTRRALNKMLFHANNRQE